MYRESVWELYRLRMLSLWWYIYKFRITVLFISCWSMEFNSSGFASIYSTVWTARACFGYCHINEEKIALGQPSLALDANKSRWNWVSGLEHINMKVKLRMQLCSTFWTCEQIIVALLFPLVHFFNT